MSVPAFELNKLLNQCASSQTSGNYTLLLQPARHPTLRRPYADRTWPGLCTVVAALRRPCLERPICVVSSLRSPSASPLPLHNKCGINNHIGIHQRHTHQPFIHPTARAPGSPPVVLSKHPAHVTNLSRLCLARDKPLKSSPHPAFTPSRPTVNTQHFY